MARVRILGPRGHLDEVLAVLQDTGVVHLAEARAAGMLRPMELGERELRHVRRLRRLAQELDAVLARPGGLPPSAARGLPPADVGDFARWSRGTRRMQRELDRIDTQRRGAEEERTRIFRFEQFVRAFHGLLPTGDGRRMQSYNLVLRGEDATVLPRLQEALAKLIGDQFLLETSLLPSGERAAVLLVHHPDAPRVERLLAQAGVHEMAVPEPYLGRGMAEILPDLVARREALDRTVADLDRERSALLAASVPELQPARAAVKDRLLTLAARERAATTPRSFVVEGWVPEAGLARLSAGLARRFGDGIVVEAVGREEWHGEEAPVVLTNPRLFRPFELVTRLLPLPKYGSIDPTPFVGVFFPMFFGLILGDIGYGLVLAVIALVLRRRFAPESTGRAVAEILGAASAFTVAFGLAFGEFFGDLGTRLFGLHPLVLHREEALLPFLGLAVAIGVVHIGLGLVLGVVNTARGHPRQAVGRGLSLLMLLLVAGALMAAAGILPGAFFTPAVIALLVAFPLLVIAEGIIAPIEFLSTLSNVLSYARIMALGTASVMMAVVANQLAGTVGGVVVGLLFGLLFHLVNFALGVFAPTIHGLRLHYVEFFGKFYSPGGQEYRPLGHWRAGNGHAT